MTKGCPVNDVAAELRILVDEASVVLARLEAGEVSFKAQPDAWSKQEILGHLIDSAANNHQRFVRAAANPTAVTKHVYSQTDWVRIQQYHASDWNALLVLWSAYNRHLSTVIEHLPSAVVSAPCDIGQAEPVSLAFVIRDYLRHVRHHLEEIMAPPHPEVPR
jgi:hypothetical protein